MSIEIIEESNALGKPGLFLPPVVAEVKHSCRSAFGIVINILLTVVAAVICICGLSVGAPIFLLSLTLLIAEVIGFAKSKNAIGGYGLALRKNAYLICAILLLGFAVFSEFCELYHQYCNILEPLYGFAKNLPKPFCDIVGIGFMGEVVVCGALGAVFLALGLSYGSLNRSKHNNLPFSKTLLFSFIISILASAVLVCDGLERLHIITPSNYIYEDWTQSLVIAKYCDVGICFSFGAVVLMQAIRLLIIFIRMRKVKNAVLKA